MGTGSYSCSEWHKTGRDISCRCLAITCNRLVFGHRGSRGRENKGELLVNTSVEGGKWRYKGSEQPFSRQSGVAMRAVTFV